ncbi:MAG: carboxypeptidase-like regulatory domain-containing protein [Rhodothermia bacterium]|nr:carboxypeptidase-like regulatory domain-containing protein [Rhodothermia bacterium]
MSEHQASTDQTEEIKLSSTIEQVMWTRTLASPGAEVGLRIFTHNVGNGANMEIKLSDNTGASHGTYQNKIHGGRFSVDVLVPDDADGAFFATVKLADHGLEKKSDPLMLLPGIEVSNAKWSQSEASRGDIVQLTADIRNAPDFSDAEITVFELDPDGAHEVITKLSAMTDGGRVEVAWEFDFPGDVKDIPSHAEADDGYKPPQFFFRVDVFAKTADSDLLTFKDFVEVRLRDDDGAPIPDAEYVLHLPDGSQRTGTLDAEGTAREEDVPPGVCVVVFPEASGGSGSA